MDKTVECEEGTSLLVKLTYTHRWGPIQHYRVNIDGKLYDTWHWCATGPCMEDYEVEMEDGSWRSIKDITSKVWHESIAKCTGNKKIGLKTGVNN